MNAKKTAERDGLQVIAELCGALGIAVPAIALLSAEQLPSMFHALLVHDAGMTSTLERHWRETVRVQLLAANISIADRALFRCVVLRTQSSDRPVEVALIRIPLDPFAPAVRVRLIEAEQPFGTLLTEAGIRYQARPRAYFTCTAEAGIAEKLGLRAGTRLYGRISRLLRDDGMLLCETVEALPEADF